MNYDFDKVIDRTNTNSLKYDFAAARPTCCLCGSPTWIFLPRSRC